MRCLHCTKIQILPCKWSINDRIQTNIMKLCCQMSQVTTLLFQEAAKRHVYRDSDFTTLISLLCNTDQAMLQAHELLKHRTCRLWPSHTKKLNIINIWFKILKKNSSFNLILMGNKHNNVVWDTETYSSFNLILKAVKHRNKEEHYTFAFP